MAHIDNGGQGWNWKEPRWPALCHCHQSTMSESYQKGCKQFSTINMVLYIGLWPTPLFTNIVLWKKFDFFHSTLFHLFIVSTGMVQVCEHVTCLDPCSWKPHDPNMSIRYREPSPGTETEEEPWVYKVTSSTTKGNLNVSAVRWEWLWPNQLITSSYQNKDKTFLFYWMHKKVSTKSF